MKLFALVLAFVASVAFGAPNPYVSQLTASTGNFHNIAIPAGPSGEMLLVVGAFNPAAAGQIKQAAGQGSWTAALLGAGNVMAWVKLSDGTESVFVAETTVNVDVQAVAFRVSGQNSVFPLGFRSFASGNSVNPDPPMLFIGASADTLLVAIASSQVGATLPPANYSGMVSGTNGLASLAVAFRTAIVSSENPGAFVLPSASPWKATTLAFR